MNVITTHAVNKMRPHIKMLAGNYLTFEEKSKQSGGSPYCRLCSDISEPESLEHLISKCEGIHETRTRILNTMSSICQDVGLDIDLTQFSNDQVTRFVLDPSSMTLTKRISISHPPLPALFQLSRDFCYTIDRKRMKVLTE